jgi:hypothetical protein
VHVNLLGIRALLVHALNEQAKAFYLGQNCTTCASSSVLFTSRICVLLDAVILRSAARMTALALLPFNQKKYLTCMKCKKIILGLIN